jgi:hypothetical protein
LEGYFVNIKKILKIVAMSCLAGVMALTAFGCKSEPVEDNKLAQQYENIIYYFRQGFKDGWKLTGDPDGKYSIPDEDLVIEINKEADPTSGRYCVYKQKEHSDIPMTSSLQAMYGIVTNPEHELYFNTRMGVRDDFKLTNEEPIDVTYNGYQFYSATYTFTKDGADWQGQFYLLPHSRQYYVVAYEAAVAKWAEFEPDFLDMIQDFWSTGFESGDDIS